MIFIKELKSIVSAFIISLKEPVFQLNFWWNISFTLTHTHHPLKAPFLSATCAMNNCRHSYQYNFCILKCGLSAFRSDHYMNSRLLYDKIELDSLMSEFSRIVKETLFQFFYVKSLNDSLFTWRSLAILWENMCSHLLRSINHSSTESSVNFEVNQKGDLCNN